jgi:hypothetical protein
MIVKSLDDITRGLEERAAERLLREIRFVLAKQSPNVQRAVLIELASDVAANVDVQ